MSQDGTGWVQHHPTQAVTTSEGETVEIDTEMVPLIAALWKLGYLTDMSCQDTGEYMRDGTPPEPPEDRGEAAQRMMGRAWVRMPEADATRLMGVVEAAGMGGSWRVFPETRREGWASITFPKEQIPAVVDLLSP